MVLIFGSVRLIILFKQTAYASETIYLHLLEMQTYVLVIGMIKPHLQYMIVYSNKSDDWSWDISLDRTLNDRGRLILDIVRTFDLLVMNGRIISNEFTRFTTRFACISDMWFVHTEFLHMCS